VLCEPGARSSPEALFERVRASAASAFGSSRAEHSAVRSAVVAAASRREVLPTRSARAHSPLGASAVEPWIDATPDRPKAGTAEESAWRFPPDVSAESGAEPASPPPLAAAERKRVEPSQPPRQPRAAAPCLAPPPSGSRESISRARNSSGPKLPYHSLAGSASLLQACLGEPVPLCRPDLLVCPCGTSRRRANLARAPPQDVGICQLGGGEHELFCARAVRRASSRTARTSLQHGDARPNGPSDRPRCAPSEPTGGEADDAVNYGDMRCYRA